MASDSVTAPPSGDAAPDRLAEHLLDQLTWHWTHQLRPRLDGLTDAEYLWEPVGGCWTVRRRGEPTPETVTMQGGSGEWVVDFAAPAPEPAPVTTIAWRLGHVVVGVFGMRVASHFGGPPVDYFTHDYPGTAAGALARLDDEYAAWCEGVRGLDAEALWRPVGEAEGPFADLPMIDLVLHIHREVVHHGAEISLLRDLYAHRA